MNGDLLSIARKILGLILMLAIVIRIIAAHNKPATVLDLMQAAALLGLLIISDT